MNSLRTSQRSLAFRVMLSRVAMSRYVRVIGLLVGVSLGCSSRAETSSALICSCGSFAASDSAQVVTIASRVSEPGG